jgi:hypothetical protein
MHSTIRFTAECNHVSSLVIGAVPVCLSYDRVGGDELRLEPATGKPH